MNHAQLATLATLAFSETQALLLASIGEALTTRRFHLARLLSDLLWTLAHAHEMTSRGDTFGARGALQRAHMLAYEVEAIESGNAVTRDDSTRIAA